VQRRLTLLLLLRAGGEHDERLEMRGVSMGVYKIRQTTREREHKSIDNRKAHQA
jgi:hypothetical protein